MKNVYKYSFWVCLLTSILLMGISLICPPRGVIDSSVIMAVGELFLFPTLAFGAKALEDNHRVKISKGNLDIEISDKE